MLLQRYVIIVATAFGGAWTMVVGGMAMAGDAAAMRATAHRQRLDSLSVTPMPGQRWVPVAWMALGLVGTAVQLGITGKKKR